MSDSLNPSFDRTRKLATIASYATFLLLISMFVATHVPGPRILGPVLAFDKAIHCVLYLALTVSTLISLELSVGLLRPQHYFTVWLLGTFYGAFDEVTQIPVGRHCDPLDWMCDILGIVIGLTFFRLLRPLLYRLASLKVAAP